MAGLAVGIGFALLAYAALQGAVSVHLVLVVPVLTASGPIAAMGALSAIGGLIAWLWIGFADAVEAPEPADEPSRPPDGPERASEPSTRGGGVLLLGPIPIAWGTERGSLLTVIVAATVLLVVALVASLLL